MNYKETDWRSIDELIAFENKDSMDEESELNIELYELEYESIYEPIFDEEFEE